ncbi:MAG: methyltransferase domain-containing protein [Proteobacteria bacterium]|nr:methyltransferase domain-containing protein [Pseudomonadota bacterium]
MDTIFHPLSVLENIDKNHAKALVVGPRNEADLLSLMGFGFQKKNVEGLDLISYSPMIQVGDIHNTNFKNDQFDVLVAGWVLSYSKNQPKFANECLRIVKNGGVIAIGVEYTEMNAEDELSTVGYSIVDQQTAVIQTTKAILDLFGSHIDHVYFNHDAPLKRSHQKNNLIENPSSVVVIFSIKK